MIDEKICKEATLPLCCPGAEDLRHKGDMLFVAAAEKEPIGVRGCYVFHDEIEAVVRCWLAQSGKTGDCILPAQML